MGQLVLDGSLTLGPASGADGTFPAATANEPLFSTPNPKLFNVATGILQRLLNSASYVALQGVGTTDTVTKGDTLYLKGNAGIKVRITCVDPAGGSDIVSEIPVYGTVFLEFPSNGTLKLLEAKGTSTLVYFVSGQQ